MYKDKDEVEVVAFNKSQGHPFDLNIVHIRDLM